MEMKEGRVLAYSMAKVIETSKLSDVSGGGFHFTTHETLKHSGEDKIKSMDMIIDGNIDW